MLWGRYIVRVLETGLPRQLPSEHLYPAGPGDHESPCETTGESVEITQLIFESSLFGIV